MKKIFKKTAEAFDKTLTFAIRRFFVRKLFCSLSESQFF